MTILGRFEVAFALIVTGAITLIIVNIIKGLGIADFVIPFYWLMPSRYIFPFVMGVSSHIIVNIIAGLVALISSGRIHSTVWTFVPIFAGFVAGGIGGILIIIGGLLALISTLTAGTAKT
ncbi:hypothetical protein [[Eubacterium] cellulosolvens]